MTHKSNNSMWKLDLLEAKYFKAHPRFPHTKKLLQARNNTKLWKKLPGNKEEAEKEINALKVEYFGRKYYASHKKLSKEVNRFVKPDIAKWRSDDSKKSMLEFVESPDLIENLITSKLVKTINSSVLINKELRENIPRFIPKEVKSIIQDKTHASNPSRFFINHCQNNKDLNNYISNMWNNKAVKKILQEIEWSFKIVRGNLSKQEKDARQKLVGKTIENDNDSENSGSSDESDDENDDSADENENLDKLADKFAVYDKMVGDSDDEKEQELELNPNINYNEVTDEEASEIEQDESDASHDSFFADESDHEDRRNSNKNAQEKYNLPELANGYFSGGSDSEDDDIDNDRVVKEATTQRKNRRGQRARQKIWEKKFGKEAKHVKEERAKVASERETKRLEYEERCRKREMKALEKAASGSNTAPLGARKPRPEGASVSVPAHVSTVVPPEEHKMHPSWEAKLIAEEKLKNVKFQGKKITFD